MKIIETSRRKFLQGSISLCVYATSSLANSCITIKTTAKRDAEDIPYLCNMCRNKCAGFARVENSTITKLNPNQYFPKSRNMLCPKGNAGIQAVYDKDRLKYPLIRIGERGSGRFKRVTWDEANEYIKDKLVKIIDEQKDNRSSLAYCNGEGFNKDEYIKFFGGKIGSANFLDEGSICLNTKLGATQLTIGDVGEMDVAGSDYLIISGANRYESLITPDSVDMLHTKQKLVVLDPRCTMTAIKADEFLPINPGTDLAFCLSMVYIAIKEKLYNAKYVKEQFDDFDKLQQHILSHKYTAKWAESKTHIPAEKIEQVTREFFSAKNPLYYLGRRSVWSQNDFQFRRAMVLINALAGSVNRKGGIIFGKPIKLNQEEIVEPLYNAAEGRFDLDGIIYGSSKGGSWLNFRDKVISKTAPYPVNAMFIRKHNLMQNMPNIAKTRKMLEMMDLVVVLDTMPSDTAMMADVILPECTYLEREDMVVSFNRLEPSLALRNEVIKPLYESKTMQDILKGLGKKLSVPLFEVSAKYDEDLQDSIAELGKVKAFEEGGYDLAELYKHSVARRNKNLIIKQFGEAVYNSLKTKGVWHPFIEKQKDLGNNLYEYYPEEKRYYSVDKKYRVKCYIEKLAKNGSDALPTWHDSYDFKVAKESFRMITGRYVTSTQTASTNNVMLRDIEATNHIWINDSVAKKLDIKEGDSVAVSSPISRVVIKAYPTNKIAPDVVWFAHGFGMDSEELTSAFGNGACDNQIIEDSFEKVYGCATMHHTDVQIRKL
ncbi:molybdopterin-containing oxidoreductase family protein [Sulfurimonas autotrophica]|uniref:Nitrate reductase n=1 Tax=Sulfurimonas autotrophica (strain ATCC BAA-671 / DSM 16294 / JCM 11897 / OK10) TaxID=563040 RepID=E0UQS7_SULAO|nr:molybdopterin-dependent oxidoreductase [Sulfurimonas autotrophica]ADN08808.1 Nitrate reductase [Sulfurimonas autotrophica DSM 16294]